MKLEVGMYVRTDKGYIGKLIKTEKKVNYYILEYEGQYNKVVLSSSGKDSEVIKTSHNIIDLIEVGDYVNGLIVNDIVTDIDGTKTFNLFKQSSYFGNEDIKSIVTKEQFESMSYKV